ncbi:MAG: TonB-dependent receptor [Bacteroidetes bacterium]|nr:MAG: TonB-dependent receptor [Bacteroidota bacterium]
MFHKITFLLLFAIMIPSWILAQNSINGSITDAGTGESLPGAHITLEPSMKRTISNVDGEFTMSSIKNGEYLIKVSYMGYEDYSKVLKLSSNTNLEIALNISAIMEDEVVIAATRASDRTGTTFKNITKAEIKEVDMGKDLPYILNMTPSVVSGSDAGAGVGYTSIRIRGTDISRINVTMNGIPVNDPESQGVFWVNMPDLAGSLNSIQVQRGVGTSSNGAAAFGASINMETNGLASEPFAEVSTAAGSFNTQRYRVLASTGLIDGKWSFDTRLSRIHSDGFIDRAFSDLNSYYVSGAYYGENTIIRFNILSGKEKTYQSWNGVPKVRLENDMDGMQRYADHYLYSQKETDEMIASDSRTYNKYTYENETDNYKQDHYQLLFTQKFNSHWNITGALHYTKGEGYYESWKDDRKLGAYYGVPDVIIGGDTITKTDAVHQKWLDNDFYGATFSINYNNRKDLIVNVGAAANSYVGDHYGKVVWAEYASTLGKDYQWYNNTGKKNTYNTYIKANYLLTQKFSIYGDLQYRKVDYWMDGLHDDFKDLTSEYHFNFINPKVGVHYDINDVHNVYFSAAMAQKEPTRSDFRDADAGNSPVAEQLIDYEFGYSFNNQFMLLRANAFFMDYKDQLISTGKINNVGAPIMTNIDKSYRAGLEFLLGLRITKWLNWNANISLSQNKISDYTEYVDNWNTGAQDSTYLGTTDIAFSPNVVAASQFEIKALKGFKVFINTKYVGKQYIDNSSNNLNSIDAYSTTDVIFRYELKPDFMKTIGVFFSINNVLSTKYETNAWVYSYNVDDTWSGNPTERYTMDGYFPQAGINFMVGLDLKF